MYRYAIVKRAGHAFGIRSGDEFVTLSNFTPEYVCEVHAGVDSGFIVDVTLSNGRNLGCVYSIEPLFLHCTRNYIDTKRVYQ